MRILLVEDEPSAATMLAKGLREEAYAVDIAADGETALAQAFVNDYDLIILSVEDELESLREILYSRRPSCCWSRASVAGFSLARVSHR